MSSVKRALRLVRDMPSDVFDPSDFDDGLDPYDPALVDDDFDPDNFADDWDDEGDPDDPDDDERSYCESCNGPCVYSTDDPTEDEYEHTAYDRAGYECR
jgi:hypothetical protein